MSDYTKSANNLGLGIYQEFFGHSSAVLPVLRGLIRNEDESVTDNIAKQWGIIRPNFPGSFSTLTTSISSAIAHEGKWRFVMRAAQCAALADRRIEARLVPLHAIAEDPHVITMEMIHNLGQRAVGFLRDALETDFLANPVPDYRSWNPQTNEKIARLGMKPYGFVKAFSAFTNNAAPNQLPKLLEEGPAHYMNTLYRIGTAAAVVGHGLQIEFVPFDQPFGGQEPSVLS